MGNAIGSGVVNYKQYEKNEAESGFFVQVKDIDMPEWQVRFAPNSSLEIELKRWMKSFSNTLMKILRRPANEGESRDGSSTHQ